MRKGISHASVFRNPIHFLAFGFGVGTIRFMPGTLGSLIAIPLYYLLVRLPPLLYFLILCLSFVVGIWICGKTAKDIDYPDYPGIVWDEIVGMLTTLFLVPPLWYWILIGFVLFRILDIWKPWPIRWVNDHVRGGFGIMLDDVLAALGAWIVVQILLKGLHV